VSASEALATLGRQTSQAVADVLETFCPGEVERGDVVVQSAGASPLASLPVPAVVASVSYVDGVTGGNIFVMSRGGVQRLAAAMMGQNADTVEGGDELTELELSAVGEAMNQMMAAAAAATSAVLRKEVHIGVPETRLFSDVDDVVDAYEVTPHLLAVTFTVLGEPCTFVQLVPNAFVMRMTRALSELAAEAASAPGAAPGGEHVAEDAIRRVPVRVWAELGRTRMPIAQAVGLPAGALVDLDCDPQDSIQLFVNGRPFARGRLLLVDNEWAVRVEEILPAAPHSH
jgi:flagellar motor switch protein FliN/FliY